MLFYVLWILAYTMKKKLIESWDDIRDRLQFSVDLSSVNRYEPTSEVDQSFWY